MMIADSTYELFDPALSAVLDSPLSIEPGFVHIYPEVAPLRDGASALMVSVRTDNPATGTSTMSRLEIDGPCGAPLCLQPVAVEGELPTFWLDFKLISIDCEGDDRRMVYVVGGSQFDGTRRTAIDDIWCYEDRPAPEEDPPFRVVGHLEDGRGAQERRRAYALAAVRGGATGARLLVVGGVEDLPTDQQDAAILFDVDRCACGVREGSFVRVPLTGQQLGVGLYTTTSLDDGSVLVSGGANYEDAGPMSFAYAAPSADAFVFIPEVEP
jgi:hypothetical protein